MLITNLLLHSRVIFNQSVLNYTGFGTYKSKTRRLCIDYFSLFAGSGHQIKGWVSRHPLTFLSGITLVEERLVVERGGMYLVYSQMYFKVKADKGDNSRRLLGHKVHRYSLTIPNDGKQDLLQSAHSCCDDGSGSESPYIHTSYVAGVFNLSSRDEIYVTVSHPELIYRDPTRSYLGLLRLN